MGFWMWVLTVVGGLVAAFILLFVFAEIWLRRRGRLDEQELGGDPGRLQRLAAAGDLESLLVALRSPSDLVSGQAAGALASFGEPQVTDALLWNYFDIARPGKKEYADALAKRPADVIVPRALEKLTSKHEAAAIELLRRFDVPAAREAVARFDEARASANAAVARRNGILERLLSPSAEPERTTLRFPLSIEMGGGHAASKILSGVLTGGVGAVAPNKYTVDDLVKLPMECAFCGCLPGSVERWATCSFQLASAGWGVVGVNTMGQVVLTYRICAGCTEHDDKVKAIELAVDKEDSRALMLRVAVLNAEIAASIQSLSSASERVAST
jgi:hypothetical protein